MSMDRNKLPLERAPNDLLHSNEDETLIEDCRNTMRPAERVEQKLVQLIGEGPVCISQLETVSLPNER